MESSPPREADAEQFVFLHLTLICFHFLVSQISCVSVFKSLQVHIYVWMFTHVYASTYSGQRTTSSVVPKLSATWLLLFGCF